MKKLLNLCLHSGGSEATWDQVKESKTPEATDTWCPIPHHIRAIRWIVGRG